MNEDVLTRIAGDVGEIKGMLHALNDRFIAHIAEDAETAEAVQALQRAAERQRGGARIVVILATVLSTLAIIAATYFAGVRL